jgi:DNA-binding MarR family transcriptional regulator
MHDQRPQAPGYLANLMARLFHELAGEGLVPLGIRPPQFPILVELWFGDGASRESLTQSQEMDAAELDALVATLAEDGLIEAVPAATNENLVLTDRGRAVRDGAVAAARRANQAAAGALSEAEMALLLGLMNRVIDALQAAKAR